MARFQRKNYPSQADIEGLISSWKTQIPPSIKKERQEIGLTNSEKDQCLEAFID